MKIPPGNVITMILYINPRKFILNYKLQPMINISVYKIEVYSTLS